RTKADPAFHRFQFARTRIPVAMLKQPSFMKALHDRRRRIKSRESVFDPLFPFGVREIGPERGSPTGPAERGKAAHFQKEIALFLAELCRFAPVVNFQTRNHRML